MTVRVTCWYSTTGRHDTEQLPQASVQGTETIRQTGTVTLTCLGTHWKVVDRTLRWTV